MEQSIQDKEKEVKYSLKRYQNKLACIQRLEQKVADLDDRLTTVRTPTLSGMPRGGSPVTTEDLIGEKADLESRIVRMKKDLSKAKAETYHLIDMLDTVRQVEVFEAHFIDGLSFEDIAEKMHYTSRNVYALYKKGVRYISENLG